MINTPGDPGYRPPAAAGKPDDDDDDELSDDEENSCTAAVSKATTSLSTWYVIYLMNISPCAASRTQYSTWKLCCQTLGREEVIFH